MNVPAMKPGFGRPAKHDVVPRRRRGHARAADGRAVWLRFPGAPVYRLRNTTMTHETCPNCGAEVPPRARACPECGADEATGWNDRAEEQRLGISDPDDFDREAWEREEFGPAKRPGLAWYWLVAGVLVLVGLLWWAIPW
jgi:hypothetical protein